MPKILAIVGPTASGKTALSIALARVLDGEILSCDSMQIYRNMNIGTAKPSIEERRGVPHHLLDIADPNTPYSCADYQKAAREAVAEVLSRGKLPIFCGGTGLYLDSVLYDRPFDAVPCNAQLRQELQQADPQAVYAELQKVDPDAAAAIHPNNHKRVIRALEVYRLTGKPKTRWDAESRERRPLYDATLLGLDFADRQTLYDRIDLRVELMLQAGLEQEVRSLRLQPNTTAAQAIGYREFLDYFEGKCDYQTAVGKIKQNSRNYAKRQLTWFRAAPVRWILRNGSETENELTQKALSMLCEEGWKLPEGGNEYGTR